MHGKQLLRPYRCIRAPFQQFLGNSLMTVTDSLDEGGPVVPRTCVDITTVIAKQGEGSDRSASGCAVEGSSLGFGPSVDGSAEVEEHLDSVVHAVFGGEVECGHFVVLIICTDVWVGPGG